MRLLDAVRRECVVSGLSLSDKENSLQEVARIAKECPILADVSQEAIFEGLKQREALGSTGFGDGIAIPHCRLPEATEFVVGLLTVPDGVTFDALDDKPVRIIVFIVGPERESNEHISLLSEISHALTIPGAAEEMIASLAPEALRESFLRHSRDNVDTKDHTSKNLFHVFVHDEALFHDVLRVFAAMEPTSLAVVEAKDASEYLGKLPLFAGFWSDRQLGVCRTITALVEKRYTNEAIRRIERIAGKLDESMDIAIAVQGVFYAAGCVRA